MGARTGRLGCSALWVAAVTGSAAAVACCGGAPPARQAAASSTTTAAPATSRPTPPPPVRLQLELPMIGLSSAPQVSYATSSGHPAVRGLVSPAAATIYLRGPDGTRTAVNPRPD